MIGCNHVLFAMCRNPQTCVVLNAEDGKILASLPIGKGSDGGVFNPATQEAFSSGGDGTLTVIKETSPTSFEVEQTLQTKPRAKTCTLDTKNNRIVLITTEPSPTPTPAADTAAAGATPPKADAGGTGGTAATAAAADAGRPGGSQRGARGSAGPSLLDILVVGR